MYAENGRHLLFPPCLVLRRLPTLAPTCLLPACDSVYRQYVCPVCQSYSRAPKRRNSLASPCVFNRREKLATIWRIIRRLVSRLLRLRGFKVLADDCLPSVSDIIKLRRLCRKHETTVVMCGTSRNVSAAYEHRGFCAAVAMRGWPMMLVVVPWREGKDR